MKAMQVAAAVVGGPPVYNSYVCGTGRQPCKQLFRGDWLVTSVLAINSVIAGVNCGEQWI